MHPSKHAHWDWKAEGFLSAPVETTVRHPMKAYRVWGGTASEMGRPGRPGVCLSFHEPATRREAEGLFSIWEWGNDCRWITTFELAAGSVVFVGIAHPGDAYLSSLGKPGSQVFIERDGVATSLRKIGAARELRDDMGSHVVVPNKEPAPGDRHRWS